MAGTTVRSLEERLDDFESKVERQLTDLASKLTELMADFPVQLMASQRRLVKRQERVRQRLDVLTAGQATTQAQLASVVNSLSAHQTQAAVLTARLDGVVDELKRTQTGLDATVTRLNSSDEGLPAVSANGRKLDELRGKFDTHQMAATEFRAEVNTTLRLARWIGATAVVALVSVILAAFAVARSAGSVEATIQQQQKTIDEIRKDVQALHAGPK